MGGSRMSESFVPRWQQANAHSLANMYRCMLEQDGVTGDDLSKPIIGIANSGNEVVPGHRHLGELAAAVKEGVRAAGGVPLEFGTIAVCDGMGSANTGFRFVLPSRELVADSVEVMAEVHHFDGLVGLSACDKINPGMLMAAARLDRPFILMPGGIGRRLTPGHLLSAGIGPGSETMCPADHLGTALTMQCLAEGLGMAPLHAATTYSQDYRQRELAYWAGQQIVRLVREDLRPSRIMTPGAFSNAVRLSLALGASMNAILHLPAIAAELGISLTLDDFDRLSRETPYLTPLRPNGPCKVSELEEVGGIAAVMKVLAPLLDLEALTCSGETWAEIIARSEVGWEEARRSGVLRPLHDPVRADGGLAVLYGTLAPEGAVVRLAGIDAGMEVFEGPARVFDSEMEAWPAIKNGEFASGEVLVIRYEGPVGGPGMPEESNIAWLLQSRGHRRDVYLLTDGRFSGGQAGQCIGFVAPEAALGGPLALVENGDRIRIDLPARRLDLLVPDEVVQERRRRWMPPPPRYARGYLARYIREVGPAARGACLR